MRSGRRQNGSKRIVGTVWALLVGLTTQAPAQPVPAPGGYLPHAAHPVPQFHLDDCLVPAGIPDPNPDERSAFDPPPCCPTKKGPSCELPPVQLPIRCYFGAEYLLWWIERGQTPPLVTSGSLEDQFPGALGQPCGPTQILYQGRAPNPFSGVRLTGELWWQDVGVQVSGFLLENRSDTFAAFSNGGPLTAVLARPFFNPVTLHEDADPVAVPGLAAGGVAVALSSQLRGAEANFVCGCGTPECHAPCQTLLAGFRFLDLDEDLDILSATSEEPAGLPNTFGIRDLFSTRNRFYGGQVGAQCVYCSKTTGLLLRLQGKVALGATQEQVQINGATTFSQGSGTPITYANQGLLVQPTNAGSASRTRFAAVPEVNLDVGVPVTPNCFLFLGYTFLYWTTVARPGDQIDRLVNIQPLGVPVPLQPTVPMRTLHSTGFWTQGLNLGVGFNF